MVFLPATIRRPRDAAMVVERLAAEEGLAVLGWRDVPHDPELCGRGARWTCCPRCASFSLRPDGESGTGPGPAGVLPAQARRARDRLYFASAVLADHRLQGHADRAPAGAVLPRPVRPPLHLGPGPGPLPVLHQHLPVLAAGPPVPVHRAQRRDQHRPGQPELDAGPRGDAGQRPVPARRRRRAAGAAAAHPGRTGQRLGQLRRVPGAAAPGRPVAAARHADDDPGAVGEPRGDGSGPARLLPVPLHR